MRKKVAYEDRSEKWYQASVWFVLLIVSIVMLSYLIYHQAQELNLLLNGNRMELLYDDRLMIAQGYGEDGRWHMYDMENYYPSVRNGQVYLYYTDDIDKARPMTAWPALLLNYSIFGGLFGISLWRMIRIYRDKQYAFNPESSESADNPSRSSSCRPR